LFMKHSKKRCPILVTIGHVDHGKTTIADKIRATSVQAREPGGITQAFGCSFIPLEVIKSCCGELLQKMNIELSIPGFLLLDTPGHEAFTSLRERGGSIADLAILVIDINEGIKPQTKESIEILKGFKVPFVVAANKIDLLPFWTPQKTLSVMESLKHQSADAIKRLDEKIYELIGGLANYGFSCERFDRVTDFSKQVCIIPVSGVTGEGISELLMTAAGLSQKFLGKKLEVNVDSNAKGSVLEVKEVQGLGTVIDVVIHDGTIREGDYLIIQSEEGVVETRVKALLIPLELNELREKKTRFKKVKEVVAAAGLRISAQGLKEVISGVSFEATSKPEQIPLIKEKLSKAMERIKFSTREEGIVLKADNLGSLEALLKLCEQKSIPVSHASIGVINKGDVIQARSMLEKDEFLACVLGFNVKITREAEELSKDSGVKIITNNVIYSLFEAYEEWKTSTLEQRKKEDMEKVTLPCKIQVLPGFLFRQSNPCIFGAEVLLGVLKSGINLMNEEGNFVGRVLNVQDSGKNVEKAGKGERVAVSVSGACYGKNMRENTILYSDVDARSYQLLKQKLRELLSEDEVTCMNEILRIKRKKEPFWGN